VSGPAAAQLEYLLPVALRARIQRPNRATAVAEQLGGNNPVRHRLLESQAAFGAIGRYDQLSLRGVAFVPPEGS
jgi:hypothetical protein